MLELTSMHASCVEQALNSLSCQPEDSLLYFLQKLHQFVYVSAWVVRAIRLAGH
jgi:hypothetical protein